ncbi:DUF4238 domain-containing protein [Sphingobacterium multivorum]|uniref:DUF4238 domain-containing protein n=3 Tax=Sphingobacterium multivorum TaxID=28454 RepID=A0A653XXW2_SPHMU|nr:DUF4238 domain-containing protein [Sphingobacterium multivorum]QQT45441.1 DUF4238 domain-containing protein [Sphingobacterium multivorum]SUJ25535.1 Uncharacterised protein [Sphingobacterium multivorum]VXC34980.1 conserved hypothetical protein [Sphingobacterium multivorum]
MKAGNPINHHYVPRVYLKQFANNDSRFYQLCKQYRGISEKHVSQVCYVKDYFKILMEESKLFKGIIDDYYVEKNAFILQENSLPALISLITQERESLFEIDQSQLEILIGTLVTIKRRNPSVRDALTRAVRKEVSQGIFERHFEPYMELAWRIDKVDPMIFINKIKEEFINEPLHAEDLYVNSFIEKRSTIVQDVTNVLLASKIHVFHAPRGHVFFTSDNPGFIRNGNEIVNFEGLGDPFLFVFPITSKACIIIDSRYPSNHFGNQITIIPIEGTVEQINFINSGTCRIANKKIFSSDKDYLEKFEKRFMKG